MNIQNVFTAILMNPEHLANLVKQHGSKKFDWKPNRISIKTTQPRPSIRSLIEAIA